jgi:hypothetical protein
MQLLPSGREMHVHCIGQPALTRNNGPGRQRWPGPERWLLLLLLLLSPQRWWWNSR